MFVSFFPTPRLFFPSAAIWGLIAILAWFFFFKELGAKIGFIDPANVSEDSANLLNLVSPSFLWFFIYYGTSVGVFAAYWWLISPTKWFLWSVFGSSLLIFFTYFGVQISVVITGWNGKFGNLLQDALGKKRPIEISEFYSLLWTYCLIIAVFSFYSAFENYFTTHFIFRWRTAINDFFATNWSKLRHVEGAAQRVQEDSLDFAQKLEDIGHTLIKSIMTLITFLPLLYGFSKGINTLPLLNFLPHPLIVSIILWAGFGVFLMALAGIKLPGLEFKKQRFEAAYRKELVIGEDDESRAQAPTLSSLFNDIRRNRFMLYNIYLPFNFLRNAYGNIDNIFVDLVMLPGIVMGALSLGLYYQIGSAAERVSSSFQFLVNVWPDLIKLYSTYKRLRAFEATLEGQELSKIEMTTD